MHLFQLKAKIKVISAQMYVDQTESCLGLDQSVKVLGHILKLRFCVQLVPLHRSKLIPMFSSFI